MQEHLILIIFPAGGHTLWLDPKSMQKDQGCFCSSHLIFTKPNFGRVISSFIRSFPISLRFCFDYLFDQKMPDYIANVNFRVLVNNWSFVKMKGNAYTMVNTVYRKGWRFYGVLISYLVVMLNLVQHLFDCLHAQKMHLNWSEGLEILIWNKLNVFEKL